VRTRDPATRSLASFPPDLFSNLLESKDESSMLSSSPCRCTVFMLESRAVERRCRQLSVHPPPPLLAHLALTLPCRYCCIESTTFPPWVTSRGVHAPPLWVRFPFFFKPLYDYRVFAFMGHMLLHCGGISHLLN